MPKTIRVKVESDIFNSDIRFNKDSEALRFLRYVKRIHDSGVVYEKRRIGYGRGMKWVCVTEKINGKRKKKILSVKHSFKIEITHENN